MTFQIFASSQSKFWIGPWITTFWNSYYAKVVSWEAITANLGHWIRLRNLDLAIFDVYFSKMTQILGLEGWLTLVCDCYFWIRNSAGCHPILSFWCVLGYRLLICSIWINRFCQVLASLINLWYWNQRSCPNSMKMALCSSWSQVSKKWTWFLDFEFIISMCSIPAFSWNSDLPVIGLSDDFGAIWVSSCMIVGGRKKGLTYYDLILIYFMQND